ncbi:hypothetical protein NEOKW01_1715 [Nematocida sp. AWRm80]|nr:hypothetical protein NEOKW01_1715 [Nematocida sp. AWRm80]
MSAAALEATLFQTILKNPKRKAIYSQREALLSNGTVSNCICTRALVTACIVTFILLYSLIEICIRCQEIEVY